MVDYKLELPKGFDEYSWEVELKGWFDSAIAIFGNDRYKVIFYDPVRLVQDIECQLTNNAVFYEANLLVVRNVNRESMEGAIEILAKSGGYLNMIRESVSLS